VSEDTFIRRYVREATTEEKDLHDKVNAIANETGVKPKTKILADVSSVVDAITNIQNGIT
jgi:hypothetical protein